MNSRNFQIISIFITFFIFAISCDLPIDSDSSSTESTGGTGTLTVKNNLSYSVGVDVDGDYKAHLSPGKTYSIQLSTGSHTVRIWTETGYSRTYSVNISANQTTPINHNSW